jgi:hypothetical protein
MQPMMNGIQADPHPDRLSNMPVQVTDKTMTFIAGAYFSAAFPRRVQGHGTGGVV